MHGDATTREEDGPASSPPRGEASQLDVSACDTSRESDLSTTASPEREFSIRATNFDRGQLKLRIASKPVNKKFDSGSSNSNSDGSDGSQQSGNGGGGGGIANILVAAVIGVVVAVFIAIWWAASKRRKASKKYDYNDENDSPLAGTAG